MHVGIILSISFNSFLNCGDRRLAIRTRAKTKLSKAKLQILYQKCKDQVLHSFQQNIRVHQWPIIITSSFNSFPIPKNRSCLTLQHHIWKVSATLFHYIVYLKSLGTQAQSTLNNLYEFYPNQTVFKILQSHIHIIVTKVKM